MASSVCQLNRDQALLCGLLPKKLGQKAICDPGCWVEAL